MLRHFRQSLFTLCLVALASQMTLAQSADYFLERLAIQARLMQAKAPLPMTGDPLGALPSEEVRTTSQSQDPVAIFAQDLEELLQDVSAWKSLSSSSQRQSYEEIKTGLQEHAIELQNSAAHLDLNTEQDVHYKLLLLEVEVAAENIGARDQRADVKLAEARRRRDRARFDYGFGPAWNAWGGPWGGWGAWGAGPYFGQPFGAGFGPRCW